MSKAFTSESDHDEELAPEAPPLPPGVKNYMTTAGVERLRAELAALTEERARLRSDDVKEKHRLAVIERRSRFLASRLETAYPIDPLTQPKDQIAFGATITLLPDGADAQTWRIVGIDETDLERGWISWMSPLAGAVLGKRPGDALFFQKRSLTIQSVRYER